MLRAMPALRSLSESLTPLGRAQSRSAGGQSLGDVDVQRVGESGAAGAAAGSAFGPYGTGAGFVAGAGVELLRQAGTASGVDDPAAGRSGAYLVEHPEARGGLSLAEAWRMTFRELGARAWVNDSLQAAGSGYQALMPDGRAYNTPGSFFVVPPAGWGLGPYELWALSGWLGGGRGELERWRAENLGRAPAWYGAGSGSSAAGGDSSYWGDVLSEGGGVGGASAPVGRPKFSQSVGAARSISVPSQDKTSGAWLWLLLLGGGAGVVYLATRKGARKGRR